MSKFQYVFGLALLLSLGLIRNVNGDCTNSDGSTCSGTDCCYDGTNGLSPVLGSGGGITPVQECYTTGAGNGVTYTCTGDLRGPPFNDCYDGTWQFPFAPTCEGVTSCTQPTVPTDGSIDPDTAEYDLYSRITYACNDGYTLGGPSEAVCESGGVWNPATVPTCEVNCAKPTLDNGGVIPDQDSFSNGEVLIYECNTNYTLVGVSTTACRSGVYDPPSKPTCFSMCSPPVVDNSDYAMQLPPVDHASTITVNCDHGYSTGTGTDKDLTCNNGYFNDDPPVCYAKCPPLDDFDDGVRSGDSLPFYHNEQVSYTCNNGFTLVGSTSLTCGDGDWNDVQPVCLANCVVSAVPDSDYSSGGSVTHGTTFNVTCDSGFSTGTTRATEFSCNDGVLSPDTLPTCYATLGPFSTDNFKTDEETTTGPQPDPTTITPAATLGPFSTDNFKTDEETTTGPQPDPTTITPAATLGPFSTDNFKTDEKTSTGPQPDPTTITPAATLGPFSTDNFKTDEETTTGPQPDPTTITPAATLGPFSTDNFKTDEKTSTGPQPDPTTITPAATLGPFSTDNFKTDEETTTAPQPDPTTFTPAATLGPFSTDNFKTDKETSIGPQPDPTTFTPAGASVSCGSTTMTVLLDRALLENNGDATDVHYEDQSCVGYDYTGSRIAVTTRYDDCDTVSEQTADVIKYSNVVTYFKPTGENGSLITRDFRLKIPVACEIKRRSLLGSSFKPKLGIVSFSETGYGNFSLTLDRYSDISFTSPAPDPDSLVYLGETLFFGVTLDAVSDLTLFLDRCWATPDVYPMNPIEFTFVKDGCGLDPTVGFHDIQRLIKGFSIDAFAFIGEYPEVYLHCDVLVCDTDPASRCSQGCVTRAKRSAAGQPRGSSSKPHTISNGPMSDQVAFGSSSMNTSWLANPVNMMLVAAAGFFITMVAMVTVKKLRSHTKASKGYSRLQTEGEIEA
ncbi:mucin-5AC isoform X4 [Strongylocentrotus purpuratus]|uniref:Uncharacterized protein n=1 Tax=Strongylocentrotus purpuratus TaxID=7668 RepID=A0A7M7N931_STRPU|nr:mucin-5AC isoform X3 [Strongylocentrotus purpuratus]XP_030832984.1 mucin-5AC isoform X4 [Strongylocentrotus purpuratus]